MNKAAGGHMSLAEFHRLVRAQRRVSREAVREFVEGAVWGDVERMASNLDAIHIGEVDGGGWVRAMRTIAKVDRVHAASQAFFLQVFLESGDKIRQECEDLAFVAGLRKLLPTYSGPALVLYRGETFHNRKRRTYGLSWTASEAVARSYAEKGMQRRSPGGSVLLKAEAPADAIICAPALLDDRFAEEEYVVDRRRLRSVSVVERFSEMASSKASSPMQKK